MSEAILWEWGFKDDHHGFVLCPDCLEPREHERPDGLVQLCPCERVREPKWPGFDFKEHIHLCEVCQVHVLDSGSKWHCWFCEVCKDRVRRLNGALGLPFVPIGRHSMMHGASLSGDQIDDPEAIRSFVSGLDGLWARMGVLHDVSRTLRGELLEELGLQHEVKLSGLVLAFATDERVSKDVMFDRFVARFGEALGVPGDLIEQARKLS